MNDYNTILQEANSYTKTVVNSFTKKKFDNAFLLSLTTMALEKYMVSFLMKQDYLPEHHTLSFLADEMTKYTQLPLADIDLLEQLDDKIKLCSLDAHKPYIPTDDEMTGIIEMLQHFHELVNTAVA